MLRNLIRQQRQVRLLRLQPLQYRQFAFQSRLTQDIKETASQTKELSDFAKGKYANMIPDYEVEFEDIVIPTKLQVEIDAHKEHPLETIVKQNREKTDVYTQLQDNQIVITNLPLHCELQTTADVTEYLHKKVHRDLDVQKVDFINSVVMPGEADRLAYIKVTLGSKRQAYMSKSALRKEWLGDCLVKVKATEDIQREHFNNRTILVREIPRFLRIEHVLSIFGVSYGAVTNVELPTEHIPIKDFIEEQTHKIGSKADDEKIASSRFAELQIKQSLAVDSEYQAFLAENLDEQTAKSVLDSLRLNPELRAPEALDQERLSSLITMVSNLQAEGQTVQERKLDVLHLKSAGSNKRESAQFVQDNTEKLRKVLTYLQSVRNEEIVGDNIEDNLAKLLSLTKGELMYAYDELIKKLDQREFIVQKRLKESIQFFDEKEKILLEGKDWKQEHNDVNSAFDYQMAHAEQFISVNQQILDIYTTRKMSAEEKLYRLLVKELNPFYYGNFTEDNIQFANQDLAREWKEFALPNLFLTKTQMRMEPYRSQWLPFFEDKFKETLQRAKGDVKESFDEIYHREKQVIADVIEAQKRIKARQAEMKNPIEHRLFDEKLLTAEQRAEIQHILDGMKPRYEQSIEREQERALNLQIEKLDKQLGMAGKYQFTQTDEQRWRAMVQTGELSESDLQKLIRMRQENETQNLGYCFITFSHADEARMMLLLNKHPKFMEDRQLEFDLKSLIDHGDLDMRYTVTRSTNDSMLVEELEGLREAKKNLREFERNMDKMLPQNKKLQKFRDRAKALIEDHEFDSREGAAGGKMTELDQAKFDRKIKELEKKYPHVNFAQLYSSDQAEAAKQALHKKAYASYKAFQFLKHGVQTSKDEASKSQLTKAQQRLIDNDPYNFPMMDETVHRLISKDVSSPMAIDHGDRIEKPGRRTSITVREYLESSFGKDMMRQPSQRIEDNDMFTFQETLKKRYPMENYLKLPETEKMLKRIDDLGLEYDYKKFPQLKLKNDEIQGVIDLNQDNFYQQLFGRNKWDVKHPTEPNRTYKGDLEKMYIDAIKRQKEKDGGSINSTVFKRINQKLAETYNLPIPKSNKMNQSGGTTKFTDTLNAFKVRDIPKTRAQRMAEEGDEKGDAKFEANYDKELEKHNQQLKKIGFGQGQALDEEQQRVNNEFFYNETINPSQPDYLQKKVNQTIRDEYLKKPLEYRLENEMPKVDIYKEVLKDEAHIQKGGSHTGGRFFNDHRSSTDRVEDKFSKSKTGKGLREFFEDEQQDLDVYEHYKSQVNSKARSQDEERSASFKFDQQALQPDMPRFDSYFESKSRGLHPFESIANSFDDSEVRTQADDDFEKAEEQALYKRELMGRLMGRQLTPRQFEVLTGQFQSSDVRTERVQTLAQRDFINRRDQIRLIEEYIEKYRRKQVQKGEWTEEESKARLQAWLAQFEEDKMPSRIRKQINREFVEMYQQLRAMDNPEKLFEKEYHFDEGMGVSLDKHMADLRQQYPGAQVLSRRDRDGFAIIKVCFKPEYKFNLDDLATFNMEEQQARFMQSLEDLIVKATDGKGVGDSSFNEALLLNEIETLASKPKLAHQISSYAKFTIKQLIKERIHGIYKDDSEGFTQEVYKLLQSEQETQKPATKTSTNAILNLAEEQQKSVVEELFDDREIFRADIRDQLRRKAVKYQLLTKRKEGDFIKPKTSEQNAFFNQQQLNDAHIADLEQREAGLEGNKNNDDFDKEAYTKLKEELKQRKEAKERLLSQGLPQFKAYMRF